MLRRSPATSTLLGALWRCVAMTAIIAVLIPLVWIGISMRLVINSPKIAWHAIDDWRFHQRRHPGCDYRLSQSIRLHWRIWLRSEGL